MTHTQISNLPPIYSAQISRPEAAEWNGSSGDMFPQELFNGFRNQATLQRSQNLSGMYYGKAKFAHACTIACSIWQFQTAAHSERGMKVRPSVFCQEILGSNPIAAPKSCEADCCPLIGLKKYFG